MKLLVIFVLTLLIYADSQSQERFGGGFYVTNSQDTVHGFILNKTHYLTEILFRKTISSPSQVLTVDDVKSFGLSSGEIYIPLKFPGQRNLPQTPAFIRMVVGGGIELLSYRGQYIIGSDDKGRFAMAKGKTSNATTALKNRQINIGIFNILFQDCPSVRSEAQTIPIVEEKLMQLIKSYHTCRSLPHQEFHLKKLRRLSYIGFFVGPNSSRVSFPGTEIVRSSDFLYRTQFPVSSQPTFGIIGLLNGRGTSSILGFQGELAFTKASFSAIWVYSNEVGGFTVSDIMQTNLDYSFITLRAGLRLTGRSHKVNPYFSFGLGHQMPTSSNSTVKMRRVINGSYTEESFELETTQSSLVVWAGAGIKKNVFRTHAVFLDGNYEQSFISNGGKITSLAVRLGFMF